MHLGNGIICPVTGIPMIAVAIGTAYYAYKKGKENFTKDKILPTVALTSLVFAMQMINFAIPTTGSSGHIVGGILLAILLGQHVGFLAMCAILLVQCLFFLDGEISALGCNIFNMGFLTCYVVYPFIYKSLADNKKYLLGAILSSVLALQLGSIAVVVESALSGSITSNITMFASLMQSIHLPIGIVEGVVTAGIIAIVNKTELSKVFSYSICGVSIVLAGLISQFASSKPDGLEWSLLNMSNSFVAQTQGDIYALSQLIQTKTAILASMPSTFANLSGLLLVAVISFVMFNGLVNKKIEVYEK